VPGFTDYSLRRSKDEGPVDPYRLSDKVRKMFADGVSVDRIASETGMDVQTVKNIYERRRRSADRVATNFVPPRRRDNRFQ
jgi:DNA invertase Pin-like site-specific DNA recombinase